MNKGDWVYLGQLKWLLEAEAVDGRRIGEMLAEVEQHLAESHADPVVEFGRPAELARALAARPGVRRPGWIPPRWLDDVVGIVSTVLVLSLLTRAWWTEAAIPITSGVVMFAVVFDVATSGIRRFTELRLNGRNWIANHWAFVLMLIALATVATWAFEAGAFHELVALPKVPYLVFCAVALPAMQLALWHPSAKVRFPDHAQHLEHLTFAWFSGPIPESRRSQYSDPD